MAKQLKNILPVKYYRDHLANGIRPDGRELLGFRPVIIDVGSISTADGSAIVKIGDTTIVCGIKAELTEPKAGEPNKGFLIPNVELPPLCSPQFRPGPPSDQAQVTSCLVADIIKNSQCVDLTELCIHPDKLVWVLYCDIICINHDGALTDACILALISALKTVTLPEVEYDSQLNTKLVKNHSRKKLDLKNIPFSTTFAIFDDIHILADPTSEEESLCTGILSIATAGANFASINKPGGSPLTDEQIDNCMKLTIQRSDILSQHLKSALAQYKPKKW